MVATIELLIDRIGQLCVIPAHNGGPQRGQKLGDLGIISDAALAIQDGQIVAAGSRAELNATYDAQMTFNADGRVVTPGLVDSHTHLIWASDRAEEFEQRIGGATYTQIMEAGGGINYTVRATRAADLSVLVDETAARLARALAHGTTTLECKTGYGLDVRTEIKSLNAIALLDAEQPVDLVPTFLGAHAIPLEYSDHPDDYVTFLIDQILPAVCAWRDELWPGVLYCDVFCDVGAFTLEQARRILEAARARGLPLRLHADEFKSLGAVPLAIELGATTVDHLLVTTSEDVTRLGQSATIAVLLPATPFGLGIPNTAPASALLAADAAIALASDCNPGTAWCENLQMALALAPRSLRLSPAQALAAATINGAFAVGKGSQIGSLEVGKRADLVIWDVADYRHLSYRFGTNLVYRVFKDGISVHSQAVA